MSSCKRNAVIPDQVRALVRDVFGHFSEEVQRLEDPAGGGPVEGRRGIGAVWKRLARLYRPDCSGRSGRNSELAIKLFIDVIKVAFDRVFADGFAENGPDGP